MKILQINKFHFPQGGADVHYLELSRLLRQKGHEVINFSMRHPQNEQCAYQEFFTDQLDLMRPGFSPKAISTAVKFIYNRQAAGNLEKLIQKTRPDIAHIHNIYHQLSPSLLLTLKKYNIPVIMTAHDHKLICPNYGFYAHGRACEHSLGKKYYQSVLHKCIKNSFLASVLCALENTIHDYLGWYRKNIDVVITPSNYLKKRLEQGESRLKKIIVLPNFVDTDFWTPDNSARKKQFVFVGRLSPEKGILSLLTAWKEIRNLDHQLLLVGTGPQENELKHFARQSGLRDRVMFLGRQPKEVIKKLYQESIATVLPSVSPDIFPLTAAESLACGTSLIVSDQGGLPETVRNGELGIIFPAGNTEKLQEVLKQAMTQPQNMLEKGRKGSSWAKKQLNSKDYCQKFLRIYTKLLQRRSQTF